MGCKSAAQGGSGPGGGDSDADPRPYLIDDLVAELVAAGLEGGSWDAVDRRLGVRHYLIMQRHWLKHGPPVYMSVASYLGWAAPSGGDKSSDIVVNAAEAYDELSRLFGGLNG